MPFTITWEKQGLLTRWSGNAGSEEMLQLQMEAQGHANFDRMRYSIHDFSACEHFALSKDNAEYSAALDDAASMTNPHIRIAIVAANPDIIAMTREYLAVGLSPYPVRYFATLEEARKWAK